MQISLVRIHHYERKFHPSLVIKNLLPRGAAFMSPLPIAARN